MKDETLKEANVLKTEIKEIECELERYRQIWTAIQDGVCKSANAMFFDRKGMPIYTSLKNGMEEEFHVEVDTVYLYNIVAKKYKALQEKHKLLLTQFEKL